MKKNKKYNDTWIYTLLVSALTILYISIYNYKFTYYELSFPYSYLLIPIILYIINYLSNRKVLNIILTILGSVIFTYLYNIILSFSLGMIIPIKELTIKLLPIFITEIINYLLFKYLHKNTKEGYILILLNYLFSFIIFIIIKSIIDINILVTSDYYLEYIINIIIVITEIIIISAIDKTYIRKS